MGRGRAARRGVREEPCPSAVIRRRSSATTREAGSDAVFALQRSAGNTALLTMLRQAQTRLEVGSSTDPLEVEAEQTAQQVVARLAQTGQRSQSAEAAEQDVDADPRSIRRLTAYRSATATREAPGAEIGASGGSLDGQTESAILSARGRGRPLATGQRAALESAFGGADFSSVRLHGGAESAALNRQMSAQAFTVGSDIFFRDGLPDSSGSGQTLLAHELTHTIQQGHAGQQDHSGQRRAANGAGASRQMQRLFGKKKVQQPKSPPISPFVAQQISSAIVAHPTMVQVEKLREEGKEDQALALIEKFWDTDNVLVKNEKGESRLVKLADFKPLMFTPSERRMLKIRKWRAAVVVKDMWDTAVRKGEAHDPNPVKEETDSSGTLNTVGGIIDDVGTTNTVAEDSTKYGSKYAPKVVDKIGNVALDVKEKLTKPGGSGSGGGGIAKDWTNLKSDVKSEASSEWKTESDTHSISDTSDSNYEAEKYSSKSEWADGIMGIIGQSIALVSSVVKTISLALDKKASKADVAAQVQNNLSQATATAGTISQAVENIRGSELTTNMFHWVPGLSIFSNGFAAIGSMVSLIQRACRIYKVNSERDKVTDKEAEDLALAMKRVWVRAAQQVEQDSFAVAKSLTNTGLAIAEVATAGGFGIPKLAQAVISAVSHVHSFGHAIADSVRAAATKDARNNYFGAKLSGSAEKLIRTDPLAAAEAIVSRAGEGDKNALELLKAYDIKVPGLTAPKEVVVKSGTPGGKQNSERLLDYSPGDVVVYKGALDKLMNALSEKDEPQTMWDKIKGTVEGALAKPGEIRDRYRQAKRIGDVRNEQDYGGKKDRGTGWALKQAIFGGESGVKKLYENTSERINTSFQDNKANGSVGPKGKKVFNVSTEEARIRLLDQIQPESLIRQKKGEIEQAKAQKKIEVVHPDLMPLWTKLMAMSIGKVRGLVEAGQKQSGFSKDEWNVLLAVFVQRLPQQIQTPVSSGTP